MEGKKEQKLAAAEELRKALGEAEAGKNEHGVYWHSGRLVEALRAFYTVWDS